MIEAIAEQVRARTPPDAMTTRVVAVDGPGGAGKTTFAEQLSRALGGAQIIHTDDFASWDEPLDWWPRFVADLLEPLARNEAARYRRTDWTGEGRELWGETVPADVVIVEGVSSSRDAFRPYLTYTVWIDTPHDVRLRRGLERDGDDALPLWERWMAQEAEWIDRERPHERADVVVAGT